MTTSLNKSFSIASDDRVFITGKTGSGKTTLAKYMLATTKRLVVIDGKDSLTNWGLTDYKKSDLRDIKNSNDYRIRLVNNDVDILETLNVLYQFGNGILYIDEITTLVPPKSNPLPILVDIWTRGRSRGIGAWSNTQRPSSIPLTFMSESEHFFIFRLSLETDRKRVSEFAGKQVLNPVRDKYGFYYYNLENDKLKYYVGLNIKGK